MPSLETLRKLKNNTPTNIGQQLKETSDFAMQSTWYNDIQTRKCYIYDYFHDNESDKSFGYIPNTKSGKVECDLKFIVKEYKSMNKDDPEFYIQFSPDDYNSGRLIPDWWKKDYEKFGIEPFIGLYADIPDDRGVYHKWLICYFEVANQFAKYGVIKVNYQFQWIKDDGIHRYKRKMYGCEVGQSSYTSGIWSGQNTTRFDEVSKFYLPFNTISAEIKHDQRLFISMLQPEPYVYRISKIKNTSPKGIIAATVRQVEFDGHRDYVNLETGEMYADYYSLDKGEFQEDNSGIVPDESINMDIEPETIELTCAIAQIKVGGGYKTLTAKTNESLSWSFTINGLNVIDSLKIIQPKGENKIKIQLSDEITENDIGKVLLVECFGEKSKGSIRLDIIAL